MPTIYEIAKGIVDLLYKIIKDEKMDENFKRIPVSLVERWSVKRV